MFSPSKKLFLLVIIIAFFASAFYYYKYLETERHRFKVVFMDVGQGDAALIQFETGEKMMVDCGPNSAVLSALGRNLPFYDRTIDYLVVTHPDLDHYGGCLDVLGSFNIKKIFVNGDDKKGDPYYALWKTASLQKNAEVVSTSTIFAIASSTFKFFSPDTSLEFKNKPDGNDRSIVFKLSHSGEIFLFTGDMEEPLEKLLVEKYCPVINENCELRSDILKVGHHGSDGSSSEIFLAAVRPKKAVISVGKNKYGHPGLRAIRHLERVGAEILRTDEIGDVVFR